MGVPILHHTRMCPPREAPSAAIPVTMIARDLQPDEFLLPHSHPWGQVTLALEGVLYDYFGDHSTAIQCLLAAIPITLIAILFLPEPAGRTLEDMAS